MNPPVWFAVGTLFLWGGADWYRTRLETRPTASALIVSQAGRDQAVLQLIQDARTNS